MWHRGNRSGTQAGSKASEPELIGECEAFLSGRLSHHFAQHHQAVPGWAWLNVLAHGGEGQIVALVDDDRRSSPGERAWRQALVYSAAEVTASAQATGASLDEIQRAVLVPLELDLIAEHGDRLDPGKMVGALLDRLDRYRAGQRR
jgi:hypothetical protein